VIVVMFMAKHFASNPRISIAVVYMTEWPPNMGRDKYVASLQEWENALFTGSLNQWNVEDRIADDIIDEVLEVRTHVGSNFQPKVAKKIWEILNSTDSTTSIFDST
jgi:hypothetical protein